ncbi:MAG: tetratricopeptide repeat protein [Fuerstiella sp.]|nr:tetratricopeptide repeat protein [Fuerstiella sp.]
MASRSEEGLLAGMLFVVVCGLVLTATDAQVAFAIPQQSANTTDAAADDRVGSKVIVTVAGAPLRTPEAIVWKAYLGETFTVTLTNGEWLWIEQKGGWLWEQETVSFDTAIEEFTKRAQTAPSAENFHLRGIALLAHKQYDEAIADFSESLKKKPGQAGVLNNRGQARYLKSNYAAAVADLNAAVERDPGHFVALNNRALCYIAVDQFDDALPDLNAAIQLNTEYPEALNNRGVVHSRKGNYQAAVVDFSAALKIDDMYIDAYGNRAFAHVQQGNDLAAIKDLTIATTKAPDNYQPINDLAWIYATSQTDSTRNPDEAVKLALRACQMSQFENWNALDTLAVAHAANGNFDAAKQWVTTALEKAPDAQKSRIGEHQQLILAGKPVLQ